MLHGDSFGFMDYRKALLKRTGLRFDISRQPAAALAFS
ncbi:hypothetical protein DESC_720485 [Desulfosarcina cetonica]|nr:hypothetical protein DESC_720485 [Desulfosarcina cetonica]